MRTKLMIVGVLVALLSFGFLMSDTYAKGYKIGLEDKLYKKMYLALSNEEELKLSDSQVEKLKKLKMDTKKDIIMKKAQIDVVAIDIKSEMYEDKIDLNAVNKLIDKKYDLKREKAKTLMAAYAGFKNILTKDQEEKLKDIWKSCKEMKKGYGMKCKKCPKMSGKR